MKAIRFRGGVGPSPFRLDDVPERAPVGSEVLIEARAAGLNRADLLQSLGAYPAPPGWPPDIPGLEYAGLVAAVGENVRRWKVGDRVMGLAAGGAFAERIIAHERILIPIPPDMPYEHAAAIPVAFFTAFEALILEANVRPGEQVLIHAASSGVGTAAIQVCRAYKARTLGTGRTREKLERCQRELGLDQAAVIDDSGRFADEVRRLTKGHGADVVLDMVAGRSLAQSIEACAPRARLLLVGLMGGTQSEIQADAVLLKRLRLIGTVLRSWPLEEMIVLAQRFEREVLPLFESGVLKPVVDSVIPMAEASAAVERLVQNATFGKVTLRWT